MASFYFKKDGHEAINSDGDKVNYIVWDLPFGLLQPVIHIDWKTDKARGSAVFVGNERYAFDDETGNEYYLDD